MYERSNPFLLLLCEKLQFRHGGKVLPSNADSEIHIGYILTGRTRVQLGWRENVIFETSQSTTVHGDRIVFTGGAVGEVLTSNLESEPNRDR